MLPGSPTLFLSSASLQLADATAPAAFLDFPKKFYWENRFSILPVQDPDRPAWQLGREVGNSGA
jgi:hypothetical protein